MQHIDTHAHILSSFYPDPNVIIAAAKEHAIRAILNIGTEVQEIDEVFQLAGKYPGYLFPAIGLHPDTAKTKSLQELQHDLQYFRTAVAAHKDTLVAIGECGFDFKEYLSHDLPHDLLLKEEYLFDAQLDIAQELELPVIIHCRNGLEKLIETLHKKEMHKGVLHSVDGDYSQIQQILDMGMYCSFNGILTFKNAINIQDIAKRMPLEKILLETDSPFLTPTPLHGQQNSPTYISYIYSALAEIKGVAEEKITQIVNGNAEKIFNISHQ